MELTLNDATIEYRDGGLSLNVQPRDKFNLIYGSLVLAGAGYLMPYNSFITCVDYMHLKYPHNNVEFDISSIYIFVAFIFVLFTNILVDIISTHARIFGGYFLAIVPLTFVSIFHLYWDIIPQSFSYATWLICAAITSAGCSVQQSSFYGYTGMLPPAYVHAVMLGESLSGVISSFNRILTKLLITDSRINTLLFFILSIFILLFCTFVHFIVKRTKFVRYHLQNANDESIEIALEVLRENVPSNMEENNHNLFGPSLSDVENLIEAPSYTIGIWSLVTQALKVRWGVIKIIWPYMISIMNAYFVTLSLFPGFETEIQDSYWKDWYPIILLTLFNVFDFLGKILSANSRDWNTYLLMSLTTMRYLLIPAFILCIYPLSQPYFAPPTGPVILTILLGITNGYYGSAPMILAPQKTDQKEHAGNLMTFAYFVGLILGCANAYLLLFLTGVNKIFVEEACDNHTISKII